MHPENIENDRNFEKKKGYLEKKIMKTISDPNFFQGQLTFISATYGYYATIFFWFSEIWIL